MLIIGYLVNSVNYKVTQGSKGVLQLKHNTIKTYVWGSDAKLNAFFISPLGSLSGQLYDPRRRLLLFTGYEDGHVSDSTNRRKLALPKVKTRPSGYVSMNIKNKYYSTFLALINKALPTSYYTATNQNMLLNENWQDHGKGRSFHISTYCPRMCLGWSRKTTKTSISRTPSRESNRVPPKYKPWVLTTQ